MVEEVETIRSGYITFEEVVKSLRRWPGWTTPFCNVLLEKKVVRNFQEAFERFSQEGAPAYVDKFRFTSKKLCIYIREAEGVGVLAHPNTSDEWISRN